MRGFLSARNKRILNNSHVPPHGLNIEVGVERGGSEHQTALTSQRSGEECVSRGPPTVESQSGSLFFRLCVFFARTGIVHRTIVQPFHAFLTSSHLEASEKTWMAWTDCRVLWILASMRQVHRDCKYEEDQESIRAGGSSCRSAGLIR